MAEVADLNRFAQELMILKKRALSLELAKENKQKKNKELRAKIEALESGAHEAVLLPMIAPDTANAYDSVRDRLCSEPSSSLRVKPSVTIFCLCACRLSSI